MSKSSAIFDKKLLEEIEKELASCNKMYEVICRIVVETGIPLEYLMKLRVCDINKNADILFWPPYP